MTEPLIELRAVDVALNGATVLCDITWSLRPREHWLIRGANGSGKSTFLRLLRGDVWPAPNRGERAYRLDAGVQNTAIEVRRHIALVSPESQERYLQQDWRLTGRDVVHTGFAQTDMLYVRLSREQRRHAEVLAQTFRIEALLDRDVQTLSTGELRKILIARAVVGQPGVLLLDEVCDGLDAKSRGELLKMLEVIARRGTQLVYATHRAEEKLSAITHELELSQGRIVRRRKETNGGSKPRRSPRPVAVPERRPWDYRGAQRRGRTDNSPLIRIQNADVFLDRKKVLCGIDWQLRRGEHWVVIGPNGAGKTTFLKLIASDLYPAFGASVSRFEFTADATIWDLRRCMGCVSPLLQTHYREELSAEDVVASGFFSSIGLMDRPTRAQRAKARALFHKFNLPNLRAKKIGAMSFGEMRKVLTLRALVHEPELLILDEPFDGLDRQSKRDMVKTLEAIAARGTQLLMVTHHVNELPGCMTHGIFIERGRIALSGEWKSIRQHRKVRDLFG